MDFLSTPIFQAFKEELEALEKKSEENVLDEEGRYKDLPLEALYTSFEDLTNIMGHPAVKGRWVDIGGGSGRSCLLYSLLKDEESLNLEIDHSRSRITNLLSDKFQLKAASKTCNLLTDDLPQGDTYFLYFPTGMVLDRVLYELSFRENFTLVVIESHGDLIPRLDKEDGYELIGQIPLLTPRHHPLAHIYQKVRVSKIHPFPHTLSFVDKLLVVSDNEGEWLANSIGLEWLKDDEYQFLYPPRTINWKNDFKRILDPQIHNYQLLLNIAELRKRGELRIIFKNGDEFIGPIRKIRLSDPLLLEISTAELLEWESILKIFKGSHLCYDSSSCSFSLPAL